MPAKPKQRHIDCFLEIVRQGSLVAAADRLAISQPTASRTLADLETILGARLMERSRSGITLTAAGETFPRYASSSAAALAVGVAQIARTRRDMRLAVNVGVLPNVASRILPTAVKRFKEVRRDVPVRVVTSTNRALTQMLRQGDLDFMVGRLAAPEDMSGLVFRSLFQEDLVAVVRPDHPFFDIVDPVDIGASAREFTIILSEAGTIIREDEEQLSLSLGKAPSRLNRLPVCHSSGLTRRFRAVTGPMTLVKPTTSA